MFPEDVHETAADIIVPLSHSLRQHDAGLGVPPAVRIADDVRKVVSGDGCDIQHRATYEYDAVRVDLGDTQVRTPPMLVERVAALLGHADAPPTELLRRPVTRSGLDVTLNTGRTILADHSAVSVDARVHDHVVDIAVHDVVPVSEHLADTVRAAAQEGGTGPRTDELARTLGSAIAGMSDREVVRAAGPGEPSVRVRSWPGVLTVTGAAMVVFGTGNTVTTSTRVERPELDRADMADQLALIRLDLGAGHPDLIMLLDGTDSRAPRLGLLLQPGGGDR
ncbi:hypothetical protein [Actinoplanes sp. NPDC051494]|uniref:hypothetical protein n=1 Tax=Actinoplanes sp. NPDC051494 TaxID=3363907 RepID=UPI0037926271